MAVKIFDVENQRVVLTPNCLLIPEFRNVTATYDDPIPALSYIYFMYSLDSPYQDIPEMEKQEIISKDVGGNFSFEDDVIIKACEKAQKLWTTPTRAFFIDAKFGLEKMGKYLRTETIKSGVKDGNDNTFLQMLKGLGTITKSFKELEKNYKEEVDGLARGGKELGYDE